MRILKYTLQDHGTALTPLPAGASILHVGDQSGAAQLWALCDPAAPLESRTFAVLYTGFDDVPDGAQYIGTVISAGGAIVHVFEIVGG